MLTEKVKGSSRSDTTLGVVQRNVGQGKGVDISHERGGQQSIPKMLEPWSFFKGKIRGD